MPTLNANQVTAPGVYVTENVAGVIPAALARFNCCYMIGTGTTGLTNTPVQVISEADFTTQFGVSPSVTSVRLFFRNYPTGILWFVRSAGSAVANFITAIQTSFDPDFQDQGFLIAPEAFETLTLQGDRTSVAIAMENLCSTEGYDWMAFADSGPAATVNTSAQYQTEGLLYTTPRGHIAYFCPHLIDLENADVAASAAVVAIALRRYADQGFNQPPAGFQYPIRGVKNAAVKIVKAQQAVLNPLGINAIRYFPNQGTIVYGSRTRSANPYYRFINTRVIFNVLNGTLKNAFNGEIFSGVDGRGVLFTRIRETANAICWNMWQGGALFGASPGDAFFVKCDRENNPAIDLENGIVRVDVYAVPSPTAERILVGVYRVAIDGIPAISTNRGV
jgi:uncharacterized protein